MPSPLAPALLFDAILRLATSKNDQTMMHPEMNASSSRMARAMVIGFVYVDIHILRFAEVRLRGTLWDIRSTSISVGFLNAHGVAVGPEARQRPHGGLRRAQSSRAVGVI